MTKEDQANFMIDNNGSIDKAITAHKKIMKDIEDIYESKDDCIKNSMSYGHLQDVLEALENKSIT